MASRNYTVGRGEVHFAPFVPGTQTHRGFRYIGNTPEFSLTLESEKLDHYNSDRGIREKDASVTIEVARSGSIITDEISPENIAMFLFGGVESVTKAGGAVVSEHIDNVLAGHSYQLGASPTNPIGARMLAYPGTGPTLLTVKDDAGSPVTFTAGTDYVIDPKFGLLTVMDGGAIVDGKNLRVSYTELASTYKSILSGSEPVNGALQFRTRNPIGEQFNWLLPWVAISPNGDYNLKGDEWQQIPFSFEVLRKDDLEAIYVNGAPFTAP